jgi:hypothetical protein
MVAEAPAAEAGRIKLKIRAIESRADMGIFLFPIAAPSLFIHLHLS